MLIDFECKTCGAGFELESEALLDDPEILKCPNCRNKVPEAIAEQFGSAMDDMLAQLDILRKKFSFSITFDSDDIELFEEDEDEEDEEWEAEEELDEPFEEEL